MTLPTQRRRDHSLLTNSIRGQVATYRHKGQMVQDIVTGAHNGYVHMASGRARRRGEIILQAIILDPPPLLRPEDDDDIIIAASQLMALHSHRVFG